ncbi:hypothetical protein F5X97DRAFT_293194 [Nemania serpens]|nr:hypothetical protein F5X97DRAFT_293194 [Nemania serpens]
MQRAFLASLALVALVQAAPITEPTKTRDTSAGDVTIGDLPKPTFIILPPITGPIKPSDKRETVAERQIIVADPDPTKAKIAALELEYEALLHTFGNGGPKPVQNRIKAIKDELLSKYGITIVQSPDGTSTIFVPGKRDLVLPGGSLPGGPLSPSDPLPGGPLSPENPLPGGPLAPESPLPGGPLIPDGSLPGGTLTPEDPLPGGPLEPSN